MECLGKSLQSIGQLGGGEAVEITLVLKLEA